MLDRGWRLPGRLAGCILTALAVASPVLAQEPVPPTPPPPPAQPAAPAPASTPAPAALPAPPAWAPMQASTAPRRGWFGVGLSCEDCFIQRGPGRVAYVQAPAINSVESGSPAWQAGMRTGDTIVSIDGLPITTPEGFERWGTVLPGQSVRVGLRRAGQQREVTVVPVANPSAATVADFYNSRLRTAQVRGIQALRNAFRSPFGWLGMGIQCEQCSISPIARRQQTWTFRGPAAVYTVDVDGPAHRAGLRRGDTLTAIDGVDLTTPEGGRAFAQVEPGQHVTLTVRRDGRERRVPLVAVAQPDATPEELAAFEEYRRTRDSAEATYREVLNASVQRARAEITDLERSLRELEASRGSVDSSRKRIATIDSVLRALRNLERQRMSGESGFSYSFVGPQPYVLRVPPVAATAPMAIAGGRTMVYPLRYSGRLGEVVNVEVRSLGAPSISEVGDSLIVVTANGVEVKVQLRGQTRR